MAPVRPPTRPPAPFVVVVVVLVAVVALGCPSCAPAGAKADVKDGVAHLDTLIEPVDVAGTWKVRFGDDPAWKDPDHDDDDWTRVAVPLGLGLHKAADGSLPFRERTGLYWYRLRVELPPPALRPLANGIIIGPCDSALEVFVDGVYVGGRGRIPGSTPGPLGPGPERPESGSPGSADDDGENAHNDFGTYPIPREAEADGVIVVAVRGWRSPERADSNPGRGGITHRPLLVGDLRTLSQRELLQDIDHTAVALVFAVAGLYHLHLWRRRRELKSYLWFGVSSVGMSLYMFLGHHLAFYVISDAALITKLMFASVMLAFPAFLQFLWPFLDTPIRWWWRVVQGLSVAFAVGTLAWPSAWFVHKYVMAWAFACALPEMIGLLALVVRKARRGDPEARTVLVGAVALLLTTVNNIGVNQNWWRLPELTNVAFTLFVLSMVASQSNRFARVYGQLDDKNAELVRMDRLKDEFLANTSHELRTPLNGILGITEGLIDGAAGPQSPQSIENLSMILTSGQRLAALINDILDFSKLREGKVSMQLTPLDIQPAVDIVVRLLSALASKKGLALENRVPRDLPPVLADEGRLQQILANLIGNAIKFTEQGHVVVDGTVDTGADGAPVAVAFSVTDTGPGIAAKDHERIFNAFEQGDGSTERSHGGTGLGLSITRRLVELHGGTISLASMPGRGSRFTVRLPLATEAARERALLDGPETVRPRLLPSTAIIELDALGLSPDKSSPPASSSSSSSAASAASSAASSMEQAGVPATSAAVPRLTGQGHRRFRVLVVDDEPINIRVLENHLSALQFDVARAGDGPAALKIIDDGFKPDLVLLDVMMPRMSGYEVCQQIRTRFGASEVPVVLVTAKDRVADVVSGFDAGANDYLTKPVAKGELLARIKTHLKVAKMNEATARFVPFEFLAMLGKESLTDVERGDQVQKEMSVLFSDIRSFTTIVEKNTPAENIRFINEYLGAMEPPVKDHSGFVDSFIGDAVMALFDGGPKNKAGGGAEDAVAAGVAMQRALPGFNLLRAQQGVPTVAIGVGVQTGLVTCGTIGGRFHIKCGVIGDAVNTASRIEGMTKMYGARFLVGDVTEQALPPGRFTLREVDRVMAKGKKTATTIYEVLDAEEDAVFALRQAGLARYREALAMFRSRAFVDAGKILDELAKKDPADKVVALYAERCAIFAAQPPGADWDGVVKLETK